MSEKRWRTLEQGVPGLDTGIEQAAGFILAEPGEFRLPVGHGHAEKSHVAAALAEFSLVLVAVERQFEPLRLEFGEGGAERRDRFGGRPFGIGNYEDAERRTRQGPEVPQVRQHLPEIPDTKIVKTKKEFASHTMNIVNSS